MNNITNLMAAISNKDMLIILMAVLIVFVLLLAVLGIVFVIALRKRAPVVKVVMAPPADGDNDEDEEEQTPAPAPAPVASEPAPVKDEPKEAVQPEPQPQVQPAVAHDPEEDEKDDDESSSTYVIEGQERVRYDRSFTAKLCQLKSETKEWYTLIKNELLSYERVKPRMSWRRESFRIGRMTFARLTIRGKTLCLMLAVEPDGYSGTKYAVEDVSNVDSTADTPTLYRIKSERRLKYAKEMIAGVMKELKCYKNSHYEAQDFFMPYEGDMSLMLRGLVKRLVSKSTRAFKVEEVNDEEYYNALVETEKMLTEDAAPKAAATEAAPKADNGEDK